MCFSEGGFSSGSDVNFTPSSGLFQRKDLDQRISLLLPGSLPSLSPGSLPSHSQPGYHGAVRVALPLAGASARIVVSPGHLDDAILQTPGGQSGDPFSPHYSDLHEVWAEGSPSPLLPGTAQHTITLLPKK